MGEIQHQTTEISLANQANFTIPTKPIVVLENGVVIMGAKALFIVKKSVVEVDISAKNTKNFLIDKKRFESIIKTRFAGVLAVLKISLLLVELGRCPMLSVEHGIAVKTQNGV